MSRTKRRDPIDTAKKLPDMVFMGEAIPLNPSPKEVREAHQDGKPYRKPGKRAKEYLSKGAKAKTRRQLDAVVQDPDDAVLPTVKKDHVWLYN